MKHILLTLVFLFAVSGMAGKEPVAPADLNQVSVHRLPNGLTVWLNEDHTQPLVSGCVVVKAGAKDCPDTGLAHYFEHLMFKGTDKLGTVNYAEEKVLLDSISMLYDQLAKASKKQAGEISANINRLSVKAAKYVIPNEFDRLTTLYGGSGLNAGTGQDQTSYYNTFDPRYMHHWLALNSERLRNPVFRTFQNELETVYEEKNMYADDFDDVLRQSINAVFYGKRPYAYPIIGSTENLKKPRLSLLNEFYANYYVPSNMALILSGNFDSNEVLPLIAKTFGTLPAADAPERSSAAPPKFRGETKYVSVPFGGDVKLLGYLFNMPGPKDEDLPAFNVAMQLLYNDNATGVLDQLRINEELVMVQAGAMPAIDGGMGMILFLPKYRFDEKSPSEDKVWEAVELLTGNKISTEQLEAAKLNLYVKDMLPLENPLRRSVAMAQAFAQGQTWDEYLAQTRRLRDVTADDVARVTKKYINPYCLRVILHNGTQKKDKLSQPGYTPLSSPNLSAQSEFARQLEKLSENGVNADYRFVDFDKDVEHRQLGDLSELYATKNPANDIFSLKIVYQQGTETDPLLAPLARYINTLGTKLYPRRSLNALLNSRGASMNFAADDNSFVIAISGLDQHFESVLALLNHFINNMQPDFDEHKKLLDRLDSRKSGVKDDLNGVTGALLSYVMDGYYSPALTHATKEDVEREAINSWLRRLNSVVNTQNVVVYSGALDTDTVASLVKKYLSPEMAKRKKSFKTHKVETYSEPLVYFYNVPDARQAMVCTYRTLPDMTDSLRLANAMLLEAYMGEGMSSLLFREVREMRSLAYSVSGNLFVPNVKYNPDGSAAMVTMLGTQADKTIQAIELTDSLFNNLTIEPVFVDVARQQQINSINNSYPSFRSRGAMVAESRAWGYTSDPNEQRLKALEAITPQQLQEFVDKNIKGANRVLIVVGDKSKIPMKELERFGRVITPKFNEFYY